EQDLEAIAPKFVFEFPEPISSLMLPDLVGRTPERGVLRHGNDRSPTYGGRPAQTSQHGLVICNMLDDVEGANKIEGVGRWDRPGIHLHELHRGRQTCPRLLKAARMQIRTDETFPWSRCRYRSEHGSVATTDLQITFCVRKETVGKSNNQFVAGHEPEM